jgi:predicted HicB family RNase H-like nuclease
MKQLNLRIPDDLHERFVQAAEASRRSLNAEILWLAERALDEESDPGRHSSPA